MIDIPFLLTSSAIERHILLYLTGGDVAATAATDQSRRLGRLGRPKNGLRSHQGDVAATVPRLISRGDSGDQSIMA